MITTIQRHELETWLGDGWDTSQIDEITHAYQRAVPAYGVTDDDEAEALLTAIAQIVDGTLEPTELVRADERARLKADETRRARRAALRASVALGMSEAEAAREYGVTRKTARAWTGKG